MLELVKVISKKTYKGKDGKEHNYTSYYLVAPNGKRVNIIANTNYDENAYTKLDMLVNRVEDQRN